MSDKKRLMTDWVKLETQAHNQQRRLAVSYAVYLLNDDYTPMNFVIRVLQQFFYLDRDTAEELMQQIHENGRGLCGVFTRDVAETKVTQVNSYARLHDYPLLCKMDNNALTLGD